jgi:UDP-GlcNAc:undecaprenyl-phosphate GlcNAc-1-phosphate transferase
MTGRLVWACTSTLLVSAGLTLLFVRLGPRWPLRARGDGRGIGGPAFALALLVGVAPVLPEIGTWLALGGAAIVWVGLLDDLVGLSPWQKLLGQSVGAALATAALSDAVPALLGVTVPIGAGRVVVSFLWVLTLTNAVNLIDGLDGLAVSVLAPPFIGLLVLAGLRGRAVEVTAVAATLAALAGFAPANRRPARLLLGDTGAELLGYLLAAFALAILRRGEAGWAIVPAVFLAGVPLADTLFAVARRLARRRPVFARDEGHIHHRLAARLGVGQAVALLAGVSLLASGAAVLLWCAGA